MREIEFRGKREDNGGWVYGGIMVYGNGDGKRLYIVLQGISPAFIEVIPETVGQYTGLKDRNGVKIFEGDIVLFDLTFRKNLKGVVSLNDWFHSCLKTNVPDIGDREFFIDKVARGNVIGNIHDSPELLIREF